MNKKKFKKAIKKHPILSELDWGKTTGPFGVFDHFSRNTHVGDSVDLAVTYSGYGFDNEGKFLWEVQGGKDEEGYASVSYVQLESLSDLTQEWIDWLTYKGL